MYLEYFKQKLEGYKICSVFSFHSTFNKDSEIVFEASFRISYKNSRSEQAHTLVETVIGPCTKDITMCMLGKKPARRINRMPLC